jgi:hypothetical protein
MKTRLDNDEWDDGEEFLRWEQNEEEFPRERRQVPSRRLPVRVPWWWRIRRWWT